MLNPKSEKKKNLGLNMLLNPNKDIYSLMVQNQKKLKEAILVFGFE